MDVANQDCILRWMTAPDTKSPRGDMRVNLFLLMYVIFVL